MNKTKKNNQNNHQFIIFTTTGYACHLPGGCSWSCSHITNESLTDLHTFSSTWQLELRHVAVTQRSSIKKKTTPSSWGCCSQLWKSISKRAKNTLWLSTQPDVHPHGKKEEEIKQNCDAHPAILWWKHTEVLLPKKRTKERALKSTGKENTSPCPRMPVGAASVCRTVRLQHKGCDSLNN